MFLVDEAPRLDVENFLAGCRCRSSVGSMPLVDEKVMPGLIFPVDEKVIFFL